MASMTDRMSRHGVQVHAVPDDERAVDSNGVLLPWGLAYSDASLNRKAPIETGTFGKTTSRRSGSRSKTATPATKDDLLRIDNQRVQDEIFGRFRAEQEESNKVISKTTPTTTSRDRDTAGAGRMQSAHDLTTTASTTGAPSAGLKPETSAFQDPTALLIRGFLPSHEPPALHFYETVSRGLILEDYDRSPHPHGFVDPRASGLTLLSATTARTRTPRTLPREALRKINKYEGGEHWIRITLDSPAAAMRAVEASPHVIGGCDVYASLWAGVGPAEDVAMPAGSRRGAGTIGLGAGAGRSRSTAGMADGRDWQSFPSRIGGGQGAARSNTNEATNSDSLSSSATATGQTTTDSPTSTSTATSTQISRSQSQSQPTQRKPRLRNARLLPLRPASEALLPTVPWSVRTFGSVPVLGSLVAAGTGHALPPSAAAQQNGAQGGWIGSTVPRTEIGEFDWKVASLWWVVCWYIDVVFGTDLCGMRDE